jgi:hypothetical protein
MEEEEILVKEYEICQSSVNSLGSQSWVNLSIIIAINGVLFSQVVVNLLPNIGPEYGYSGIIITPLMGTLMLFIIRVFQKWNQRIDFRMRVSHDRMREIELDIKVKYGKFLLQKGCRTRNMDVFYGNDIQQKNRWLDYANLVLFSEMSKKYPIKKTTQNAVYMETEYKPPTSRLFNFLYWVLIVFWFIIILLQFIQICPTIHEWMFN